MVQIKVEVSELEFSFTVHPTLRQWQELFRNKDERQFIFGIPFDDEYFDVPILFKKPIGFVESKYRPNGANTAQLTEDILDLNRKPKAVIEQDGHFWRQFTVHHSNDDCNEYQIYRKQDQGEPTVCSVAEIEDSPFYRVKYLPELCVILCAFEEIDAVNTTRVIYWVEHVTENWRQLAAHN